MKRIYSHIQLPKLILKQFMNSKKQVPYLDLLEDKIKSRGPSQLNTEYGYFNEENETFLNQKVEDKFGKICLKIRLFANKDVENMPIAPEFEGITKNFVWFSVLRGESAKKLVELNCIAKSEGNKTQDIPIEYGRRVEMPPKIFDDFRLNILVNKTELGFAVPRACWYPVSHEGCVTYVIPIAPYAAFILMDKDQIKQHIDEGYLFHGIVENRIDVERMNQYALHFEYVQNKAFIAAIDCTELNRLQGYLNTHKEQYDKERQKLFGSKI